MEEKRLTYKTCEEFAQVLAAKEPVPGGGGAAALVGALGVALCSMVGSYTTGKKAYASAEHDIRNLMFEADQVRMRLLDLVNEDAEAFYPLSQAYAMPRSDPQRAEVLEEATKQACVAPIKMMRQICQAIALLEEMGEKGSKLLLSDIGCGAYLSRAALEAASINVFVNTATLRDRDYATDIEAEAEAMLNEYVPRAKACAARVMQSIRKKSSLN